MDRRSFFGRLPGIACFLLVAALLLISSERAFGQAGGGNGTTIDGSAGGTGTVTQVPIGRKKTPPPELE